MTISGRAMEQNNVNLGSLMVRDGIYQYNVRFSTQPCIQLRMWKTL
jgi:hypothetical protein